MLSSVRQVLILVMHWGTEPIGQAPLEILITRRTARPYMPRCMFARDRKIAVDFPLALYIQRIISLYICNPILAFILPISISFAKRFPL